MDEMALRTRGLQNQIVREIEKPVVLGIAVQGARGTAQSWGK